MKAARRFFDQMPINVNDKEKIAHLNAERLLGLGQNTRTQGRMVRPA
jgi:predicted TIM-barrel fold metal-dependent hydrolase